MNLAALLKRIKNAPKVTAITTVSGEDRCSTISGKDAAAILAIEKVELVDVRDNSAYITTRKGVKFCVPLEVQRASSLQNTLHTAFHYAFSVILGTLAGVGTTLPMVAQ